jgi:hypothetical protein
MEVTEQIGVRDDIKTEHFDRELKLLEKFKTKISGKTQRPAEETITIDREAKVKIHKVWEKNDRGELELVWDKSTPFSKLKDED